MVSGDVVTVTYTPFAGSLAEIETVRIGNADTEPSTLITLVLVRDAPSGNERQITSTSAKISVYCSVTLEGMYALSVVHTTATSSQAASLSFQANAVKLRSGVDTLTITDATARAQRADPNYLNNPITIMTGASDVRIDFSVTSGKLLFT